MDTYRGSEKIVDKFVGTLPRKQWKPNCSLKLFETDEK